jgi:hypothetical protein
MNSLTRWRESDGGSDRAEFDDFLSEKDFTIAFEKCQRVKNSRIDSGRVIEVDAIETKYYSIPLVQHRSFNQPFENELQILSKRIKNVKRFHPRYGVMRMV